MSEIMRMWVEIIFNVAYLIVVWGLVILMTVRRDQVAAPDWMIARRIRQSFALLALGDTGHVGFRVIAYALGGLEAKPVVLCMPVSLVGLGALSTAVTVTFFYMLLVDIWRRRFGKPMSFFAWSLIAAGVIRLVVMAFPQNQWELIVAPYGWSLLRNALLTYQGLGIMALILRDAAANRDSAFRWVGWMIAVSFSFYAPVILFAAQVPLLGMLMIPKTCAYVAIAVIAYRALYRPQPAGMHNPQPVQP